MEYDLDELINGLEYYRFDKNTGSVSYEKQIRTRVKEVRDQLKVCCDNYNCSASAQICHFNMGMTCNMLDTTVISSMRRDIIKIMSSIEVGKKIVESGKMIVLVAKAKDSINTLSVVSAIVVVFPDLLSLQINTVLDPTNTILDSGLHKILVLLPKGEAKGFMNSFHKLAPKVRQDIVFIADKREPSLLGAWCVSLEVRSNIKQLFNMLDTNNLQLIDTNDSFDFIEIDYLYISGATRLIRTYSNIDEMHPKEEGVEN